MLKKTYLHIILLLAVFAIAQVATIRADSGIEIGIKSGIISDYSQSQLQLTGNTHTRLKAIGGRFYLSAPPVIDLIIGIDNRSDLLQMNPGGYDVDLKIRDYSVSLSVVVPIRISAVTAYFGGGIASHSIAFQYSHPAALSLSDYGIEIPESSTYPGYHVLAGLKFKPTKSSIALFVEAGMVTINSPGDNINYLEVGGGISIALPE